jgi:hypothetical protein
VNGWVAAVAAVAVLGLAAAREYVRWRGRRWRGGMRSGSRDRGR